MQRVRHALFLLLTAAGAAAAADFSGIWLGQIELRNGAMQDVAFKLEQKGTRIEGKLYGDYVSMPVVEGTANGNGIDFVIVAQEQAGNQINETRLRFRGQLSAAGLELTRERESTTNAGNAGGAQVRDRTPVNFCLKRLL